MHVLPPPTPHPLCDPLHQALVPLIPALSLAWGLGLGLGLQPALALRRQVAPRVRAPTPFE
jgi:hypothetical protein